MDQLDPHARRVAGGKEARQADLRHHRIAHDHVAAGLPHGAGAPGHGHQAHCAVEGRDVEIDPGRAVRAHPDGAGELRHQLFGRRRGLHPQTRIAVAARAHHTGCAIHPVDEAAIEIAQLDPKPPLAEVMRRRVGCLEPREVQDAQIDRRQRHPHRIARRRAIDLQAHALGRAGLDHFGRVERDGKLPVAGAHRRIGQTQRPRRVLACRHVHGPDHAGRDIGTRTPGLGHIDRDQVLALGHLDDLPGDDLGRQHRDQRRARIARHDAQPRRVARRITRLIERELQRVGRVGTVGGREPARVEILRG